MNSVKVMLLGITVSGFIFNACHKIDNSGLNTPISDYLYGVEYDDYDFDANITRFNYELMQYPACSEVRKGKFVGRNLDWYINNDATCIIKINRNSSHYASIGITGCFPDFSNELAKSGKYCDAYKYLPFKTSDGINEMGLYIGVNVAPTGETSFDTSTWKPYLYGNGAAHTNPLSDMHYCTIYLVRIVLDRAGSVEEARKLIDSIDWSDPTNFPSEGCSQTFHWLICDSKESTVLEFIDNKAVYTSTVENDKPSYATIMTNFSNCLMENGIIQDCACGIERWDLIKENYLSTSESFEGMQDLMSKVWMSKAYTTDPSSTDFWFTEWPETGYSSSYLYRNYGLCQDSEFVEWFRKYLSKFNDSENWHVDDSPLWYSTHTSIYDMEAKSLRVLVHEGRDSQKDYYEASLSGSSFAKPLERHLLN